MDILKNLWEKSKGKIAVAAVAFVLAIPAVAGVTGLELVESDEGVVCFKAAEPVVEDTKLDAE